jgi:hypothetical protein
MQSQEGHMRVLSILEARTIALFDINELNPGGKVFFPKVLGELVQRFQFQKFPTTPEQMDESKGIEFFDGQWNGINVTKVTIYFNGILLETQSSTADSQRILEEALHWASERFGLHYEPSMVLSWKVLSAFSFTTDAPLLEANSPVSKLANRMTQAMGPDIGDYRAIRLDLDFDRYNKQNPIAYFTIQRKIDAHFSANRYLTEAPLPTDVHIKLLEEFEADVLASSK